MDHVRVHPRFLHSNATSHKWALGAFAELLDNALDEVLQLLYSLLSLLLLLCSYCLMVWYICLTNLQVCNGATYVNVDLLENIKDKNKMVLVQGITISSLCVPNFIFLWFRFQYDWIVIRGVNNYTMTADNGGGMTPDKMRQCMSLGYSAKSKMANTIGQCRWF